MSKHTLGTWITGYGYVDGIGEVFGVGIQTVPNWTPICILSLSEKVNETDVANARLIAAAAELLEALENLVLQIQDHNYGIKSPAQYETNAFVAARAAIAKAKGEAKP